MAITFPSTSHATSSTVPAPSGIVNGSVLVAAALGVSGSAIAVPSGWTQIAQPNAGTSRLGVFYKVISDASSEPANYAFTGWAAVTIARAEGVLTADVIDGTPVTGVNNTKPLDIVGPTTSVDGAAVLTAGYVTNPTISVTGEPEIVTDSGIVGFFGAIQDTAGDSGTKSITSSGSVTSALGVVFALTPVPEPEPTIRITGTISIDLAIGIG